MNRLEHLLGHLGKKAFPRIFLVYLGGSWAVLEVADHLVERFGMPDRAYGFAVLVLLLGFPILFAGAFGRHTGQGPAGSRSGTAALITIPDVGRGRRQDPPTRRWAGAAGSLLLVGIGVATTLVLAGSVRTRDVRAEPTAVPGAVAGGGELDRKAIAVLPFEMSAKDPAPPGRSGDADYLADGIHGDILTHLAQVRDLKVMARSAVLPFRDGARPLGEVARALSVGSILEGSVRQDGTRLRISARLIDTGTLEHLWAASYDRTLDATNLFQVQTDIATRITEALAATLTEAERGRLARRPTESFSAWGFFSKAQGYYGRYTAEDNEEAIRQVKRALQLDPAYAEAWALLADAYSQRAFQHGYPPAWVDSAEVSARTALRLAPELPAAHKALALTYTARGWVRRAIESNERTLALNPGHLGAMNNLALGLLFLGRYDEALPWLRKAVAIAPNARFLRANLGFTHWILGHDGEAARWWQAGLAQDPSDPWILIDLAFPALAAGDFEGAIDLRERAVRAIPDEPVLRLNLGLAYVYARRWGEAALEIRRAIQVAGDGPLAHSHDVHHARTALGRALLELGDPDEGRRMLGASLELRLQELARGSDSPRLLWEIAGIYSSLGDLDASVEYAQRAWTDGFTAFNRWEDPLFDSVRGDPRFAGIEDGMRVELIRMGTMTAGSLTAGP